MKAWRLHGVQDMRLDEISRPEVTPGAVLVRTRIVQPSITEVQLMQGFPLIPGWQKMLKEKGPLLAFGHEFCAEIVEVGKGVQNLAVGDRVFLARSVPCHRCALCRAGYVERCRKGPIVGIHMPGCLSEYAVLPAECLMNIPDSISDSDAAAMQPLTSVLEFIVAAKIEIGSTVAILGQGTMGLNCAQLSRAYGAGKIIVTDLRNETLTLSSELGADITINSGQTDPVDAIMEATGGVGADIVFECAGGSPRYGLSGSKTLAQAIGVAREEGKIVLVGILDPSVTLDADPVISRGVQYVGPGHCTMKDLNYLVDLVASKKVKLAPLITHILKGIEKIKEAFDITGNKTKYKAISSAQVIVFQ